MTSGIRASSSLAMAEGTRMKSLEENIRRLEQLQQDQAKSIAENAQRFHQWMKSTNSNLEEFHKEIPSFKTKIQEHDQIIFRSEIPEVRPQIVNANSRSRSFEENLNKMEILAQQQAAMLDLWRNSTNLCFDESSQKLEGQRIHSDDPQAQEQSDNGGSTYMGGNLSNQILNPTPRATNLEANSFHGNRMSEQEFLGTLPKEIHWGHNKSSYSMKQITSSSTPTTSKLGVCLNLESELGRADREVLSPPTENMISEFKEGNSKYSEFDLIDLDGIELSSCVIDCEKRDYHGLDDNLGVRNLQLQLTIVKDSVGFKEFKFMVNARKMFDEMPTRGVLVLDALFDEEIPMSKYVEFIPLTLPYDKGKLKHRMVAGIAVFDPGIDDRHECTSWDFAIFVLVYIEGETATDHRNWVFDPGGLLANVVLRVVYR